MYTDTESSTAQAVVGELASVCTNRASAPRTDAALLHAASRGDRGARQSLYAHCLPALRRWAQRCLPRGCGGINDADDLVQIAFLRALNHLGDFEVRSDTCFLAYLRQILLNEVRSELRKQRCRGTAIECDDLLATEGDPVVEQMLGQEREYAYAGALRRLTPHQRKHVALRIEFGMSFREIATQVGGSTDGARMTVVRALRTMSEHLAPAAA